MSRPEAEAAIGSWVYYVGHDLDLLHDLRALVERKGLKVRGFVDAAELRAAGGIPPAVLILDTRIILTDQLALSGDLFPGAQRVPELICVGGEDDVESRLKAMRSGAKGFIPAPVSARKLARRAVQLAGGGDDGRHRILLVEDDPAQARYIELLLKSAGMVVETLGQPLRLLDSMRSFRPDLVLMDLYLPGASGAELTAIIRDHDEHYETPVVFLSIERDREKQQDALRTGADSFVAKPVHLKSLIDTIEHRIRLSRQLKDKRTEAIPPEGATGLVSKEVFLRQLQRAMRRPPASASGWGVVLVELDEHRGLLDRLGLAGSERLLRHLEHRISRRLAPEESAARLGDFAYGVLGQRDDQAGLAALAERLREALDATHNAGGDGGPVRTSTSIGIGPLAPPAEDAFALISRAREAAHAARRDGGNRVERWQPALPFAPGSQQDRELHGLLVQALAGDGLKLQFQPIVAVGREWDVLYEVQLRLAAPDGRHISPAELLPVAERHGLIPAIDRWVLDHALDVLDTEREQRPGLRLLVHQTLETAAAPDWLDWFRDRVAGRNLIRQRPLLELQIGELRRRPDLARPLLQGLRRLGIQVCAANCTGAPEDLTLLASLGVSLAKLAFKTLNDSTEGGLAEILKQLRGQGVATIAAGIEDPDTVARVWACGPDYIQGHFLQMPCSEPVFEVAKGEAD